MPSLKSAETDTLRILLIQCSLSAADLAAKCGVATVTIRDQIAKNFPSRRLRLIVESALDKPIWSNLADFEERRTLAARCGFDPFTVPMRQLRARLAASKLRGRGQARTKAAALALLRSRFAPHPQTKTIHHEP